MGIVLIRCPNTGLAISTGISADRAQFGRMPVFFARTRCTVCDTTHEWFARDAWVADTRVEISRLTVSENEIEK